MVKLHQFVMRELNKVHRRSRAAPQQLTASVKTSKLVVTTHYDVSVASRLERNIRRPIRFRLSSL